MRAPPFALLSSLVLALLVTGCGDPQPVESDEVLRPFRRAEACPATTRIGKSTLSSVPLSAPGEMPTAYVSFSELGTDGQLMRVMMSTVEMDANQATEPGDPSTDETRIGIGMRSFDRPVARGIFNFAHDASPQVFAEARRAGFPTGILTPGPNGRPMRNEHGQLEVTWIGPDYVCGRFSFGHANGRFEGRFKAERLN